MTTQTRPKAAGCGHGRAQAKWWRGDFPGGHLPGHSRPLWATFLLIAPVCGGCDCDTEPQCQITGVMRSQQRTPGPPFGVWKSTLRPLPASPSLDSTAPFHAAWTTPRRTSLRSVFFYPIFRIISLGQIPRNGITGTKGKSVFHAAAKLPSLGRCLKPWEPWQALRASVPGHQLCCVLSEAHSHQVDLVQMLGSPAPKLGHPMWVLATQMPTSQGPCSWGNYLPQELGPGQ